MVTLLLFGLLAVGLVLWLSRNTGQGNAAGGENLSIRSVPGIMLLVISLLGGVMGLSLLIAFVLIIIAVLSPAHRKFFQTQALIALVFGLLYFAYYLSSFWPHKPHAYWSCPAAGGARRIIEIRLPSPAGSSFALQGSPFKHPPAPGCNLTFTN